MQMRIQSPLTRFVRPLVWEDFDQEWPTFTMTEGIDVYEEHENIVVKAAVPGIPAEKVDITFEDGVLHIKAKMEETEQEKDKKKLVYRMDRVSSFDYTTTLPRPIDEKSLKADVVDGVAVITAKIAEAARPRKVEVRKAA